MELSLCTIILFSVGAYEVFYFLPSVLGLRGIEFSLLSMSQKNPPPEPSLQGVFEFTAITAGILFYNRRTETRNVVPLSLLLPFFAASSMTIVLLVGSAYSPYPPHENTLYGVIFLSTYFALMVLIRAIQVIDCPALIQRRLNLLRDSS